MSQDQNVHRVQLIAKLTMK